jgi:hypothetical protein
MKIASACNGDGWGAIYFQVVTLWAFVPQVDCADMLTFAASVYD